MLLEASVSGTYVCDVRPRVSAIITSYNHERTLRRAVESALAQTVEGLEVVLVDDASTDGSRALLTSFRDDPRVKLALHDRNQGISTTFNHGLALATAPWVAFLGSDDYWLPDHLSGALERLDARPAALLYGRVRIVDGEDRDITDEVPLFGMAPDDAFFREIVTRSNFVPFISAVFSRDVAQKLGGFDTSLMMLQDYDLWIRLSALHEVHFRDQVTACYRWNGANASRRSERNSHHLRRELAMILEKAQHELKQELTRADLEDAIQQRLATTWARLARRQPEPAERAASYGRSLGHVFRPGIALRYLMARLRTGARPA